MRLRLVLLVLSLIAQFTLATSATFAADNSESITALVQPSPASQSVLPPKLINPLKVKTLTVKLGMAVVFTVKNPVIWRGRVVDSKIAKFVAGGPVDTYEINPSLTLLKKGKTTISLTDGKKTYVLKLTVL